VAERRATILDMWLRCHTAEEIAEAVELDYPAGHLFRGRLRTAAFPEEKICALPDGKTMIRA
jgi:hypothetical protein